MNFGSLRNGFAISLALACVLGTKGRADLTVRMAVTDGKTGAVEVRTSYYVKGGARFEWSHYVGIVDFNKSVMTIMDTTAKSYARLPFSVFISSNNSSSAGSGAGAGLAFKTVATGETLTLNNRQAQKVVVSVNGKPLIEAWLSSSLKPDEVVDFCTRAPAAFGGLFPQEFLELIRQSKDRGLWVRVNNMLDNVNLELQDASTSVIAPSVFLAPADYALMKPEDFLTSMTGGKQ